ncbi:MAG: acyl-CoA dehydrogenase family protein [Mesorhizobium sp.]|nr:MAG: acyl-CoA dehydrogenase family protein [Mesorhizobium sp.]
MDFALNEEQRILRGQILRFAQDKLNKNVRQRDRDQVFQRELWGACAQMGLTGLPVPQAYGGPGLRFPVHGHCNRCAWLRLRGFRLGLLDLRSPSGLRGADLEVRH